MNKDQVDRKGKPGTEQGNQPKGGRPQKDERDRQSDKRGRQKVDQSGQREPQRDHLDYEGRRRHMGHGDTEGDRGRDRKEEDQRAAQWDDKTEGTSRQSEPAG